MTAKLRKRLAIGAILTMVGGVIVDAVISNSIYNCVGVGSDSRCSSTQLSISHFITHIIVVLTYLALAVLAVTFVSWILDKFKGK